MGQIEQEPLENLIKEKGRLDHKLASASDVFTHIETPGWINQRNPKALKLRLDVDPLNKFRNLDRVGNIKQQLQEAVLPAYRERVKYLILEIDTYRVAPQAESGAVVRIVEKRIPPPGRLMYQLPDGKQLEVTSTQARYLDVLRSTSEHNSISTVDLANNVIPDDTPQPVKIDRVTTRITDLRRILRAKGWDIINPIPRGNSRIRGHYFLKEIGQEEATITQPIEETFSGQTIEVKGKLIRNLLEELIKTSEENPVTIRAIAIRLYGSDDENSIKKARDMIYLAKPRHLQPNKLQLVQIGRGDQLAYYLDLEHIQKVAETEEKFPLPTQESKILVLEAIIDNPEAIRLEEVIDLLTESREKRLSWMQVLWGLNRATNALSLRVARSIADQQEIALWNKIKTLVGKEDHADILGNLRIWLRAWFDKKRVPQSTSQEGEESSTEKVGGFVQTEELIRPKVTIEKRPKRPQLSEEDQQIIISYLLKIDELRLSFPISGKTLTKNFPPFKQVVLDNAQEKDYVKPQTIGKRGASGFHGYSKLDLLMLLYLKDQGSNHTSQEVRKLRRQFDDWLKAKEKSIL